MKIFTQGILARRKMVLIFILAILLPSLIVGYLSLATFTKRREAVKRALESSLWVSGEAALKSIEDVLLEHERDVLKLENFIRLTQPKEADQSLSAYSALAKNIAGQLFLLDNNYQIIIPKTGREDVSVFQWEKSVSNSQFAQTLQRAESFEFSQKNYSRAAELYRKCTTSAPSRQHKTIALEGLGRCLSASRKYDEAYKVYSELSSKYGQIQNKAGHPYGVVAAVELGVILQRQNKEENSLEILLKLYENIQNGVWLLNLPAYDFFITEIESILNDKFNEGEYSEIQKSYQDLRNYPSPYLQALIFTDFLRREAVPKIKEKLTLSRMGGEVQEERFLAARGEYFSIISYGILPNFQANKTFYGGFSWNLSTLNKEILPKILKDITKDSGLHLQIIDERGQNILTGKEELPLKDSLILSYRQFPLPWKLVVSQPALNNFTVTSLSFGENFMALLNRLTKMLAISSLSKFISGRSVAIFSLIEKPFFSR